MKEITIPLQYYRKMYDNSEMAYEKVTTFKEKVFCKSLSIFSYIMKALYQEDKNTFLTFQTADEHLKNDIAERIHFEVEKVIDEFNTIKYASLIPMAKAAVLNPIVGDRLTD